MTTATWLARADRAIATASLARDIGDHDSCCRSAFFTTFYAARAALTEVGQGESGMVDCHWRLRAAVREYLVRPGLLDRQTSSSLALGLRRRMQSEHSIEGVGVHGAYEVIASARAFVAAVKALIAGPTRE